MRRQVTLTITAGVCLVFLAFWVVAWRAHPPARDPSLPWLDPALVEPLAHEHVTHAFWVQPAHPVAPGSYCRVVEQPDGGRVLVIETVVVP